MTQTARFVHWKFALTAALATGALLAALYAAGPATRAVAAGHANTAKAGAELWAKRYNGPGNSLDEAKAMAVSPDGKTVYVTGRSAGPSLKSDFATIAYNAATGAQLWVSRYNGPGNGLDRSETLTLSPDGKTVYIAGTVYGGSDLGREFATIAYNAATGAQLWVSTHDAATPYNQVVGAIAVSPDGQTVYVGGSAQTSQNVFSAVTLAYDAATGTQRWVETFTHNTGVTSVGSLSVSADSSTVYATGTGDEAFTIAYAAASGSQQWTTLTPDLGETSQALSRATNTLFVTGYSNGGSPAYVTAAYNAATGSQLWEQTGPDGRAFSVALSPDGSQVFVTGFDFGSSQPNHFVTVAYDAASGSPSWTEKFSSPGKPGAFGVAVTASPNGQAVYVTGVSSAGTTSQFGTVAYAADNGSQLWAVRQKDAASKLDAPAALAVGPHGQNLFVTGYGTGAHSAQDWLTIAYKA